MDSIGAHVIERLMAAEVESQPYPHFFIDNVFPEDFYAELMSQLPGEDELIPAKETASGLPMDEEGLSRFGEEKKIFWRGLLDWLLDEPFLISMASKVHPHLEDRFRDRENVTLTSQVTYARSTSGFVLGPHTDMQHRVVTVLFYLAKNDENPEAGTSIYKARGEEFICPGGTHYGFEEFQKLATMTYVPNIAFGFLKSDTSFHGVEPWTSPDFNRDTLQYEIHDSDRSFYYV